MNKKSFNSIIWAIVLLVTSTLPAYADINLSRMSESKKDKNI
ncbi:hypothetical protein [Peptostreptococcus russellii]|nr:hypothetical protein [Peptostreptococcus russellii]